MNEVQPQPQLNEQINFKDVVFIYRNCIDLGYEANAWFGTDEDNRPYGPCISRKEVFDMIKLIIESRKN